MTTIYIPLEKIDAYESQGWRVTFFKEYNGDKRSYIASFDIEENDEISGWE